MKVLLCAPPENYRSFARASDICQAQPQQEESDCDQGHAGDLLRALTHGLANPSAEPQPELGGGKGLDRDPDDGDSDRQRQQAGAQADRQLVDADAQAEVDDRQPAGVGEEAEPALLAVFVLARPEQQKAGERQEQDPAVARPGADQPSDQPPGQQPQDRHPGLEGGKDKRDPEPVLPLEPGDAQRGGQGEGVEGEREEEAGQDEDLAHRRSLTSPGCAANVRSATMSSKHAYAPDPGQAAAADPRLRRGAVAPGLRAARAQAGRSAGGSASGARRRRP